MTRLLLMPLLTAILALSSCVLSGTNAAKTPPAPAPPAATAAAKPPAPPPPLSTPQTQVQLPPPQAVSPAALATIPTVREELPAPETTTPPKPTVNRKPPAAAASSTKPDTTTPVAETPAAVQGPMQPAVTAPAEEQPRLQPVYTEEERRRIWGELERRKGEVEMLLRGVNQRRMSADQKSVVDRIHSFLNMAEESAKRGDFRTADALSDKGVILARELASGR